MCENITNFHLTFIVPHSAQLSDQLSNANCRGGWLFASVTSLDIGGISRMRTKY